MFRDVVSLTVMYIANLLVAEVWYVIVACDELYAHIVPVIGGTCMCINV